MDLAADLPVTLVVKAANQRVADQTVECVLGWTIRKLKQHLENVYPSKPKHNHQKLIYSGQLLADHLTLKEVLRQYDGDNSRHTVHLVCSPSGESLSSSAAASPSADKKVDSVSIRPQASATSSESDGLRQNNLHSHNASTSTTTLPATGANPTMPVAGAMGMLGAQGLQGVTLTGTSGFHYSPEQIAWMQHVYSQYMTQYMQYYGYQLPAAQQQAMDDPAPAQEQPANPNAANNGVANQNLRMNAQGGLEEDDDEFEQRDWLDYIYVFFRFLILLSIVYFYSTASRFLGVAIGFLLIYILQNGWFNRQQQPAVHPPGAEFLQPAAPPHNQPDQDQAAHNGAEGANLQEEVEEEEEEREGEASPVLALQQEAPSGPEVLARMFTTFFTSLVPTRPPAVNAN